MSRKPSFANLRDRALHESSGSGEIKLASKNTVIAETKPASSPASRQGRKQIAGFFTPEMSFAMHTLARRQGRSLQSLMAESFNDILRKYGESPIGN